MPLSPIRPKDDSSKGPKQSSIQEGTLVQYEQHGTFLLGVAIKAQGSKWLIENTEEETILLPPNRLFLFSKSNSTVSIKDTRHLLAQAQKEEPKINLESVWNTFIEKQSKDIRFNELLSAHFRENFSLPEEIAFRKILLKDTLFFKRAKEKFTPNDKDALEKARAVQAETLKKQTEKLSLELALQKALQNTNKKKARFPEAVRYIEEIAALGRKAKEFKLYGQMVDHLCKIAGIQIKNKDGKNLSHEDRAFELLVRVGHFDEHQNLSLIKAGRPKGFSEEERKNAELLHQTSKDLDISDRTTLPENVAVFTIDGEDSSDFDDALSLKTTENGFIVGVHITDVSTVIEKDSTLDHTARERGSSIYCPDETIPMLPGSLSEGVLSLKEGKVRPCISYFFNFDSSLSLVDSHIERTAVSIDYRLTYEQVDSILANETSHDLQDTLAQLKKITLAHEQSRKDFGAIQFNRRDLIPTVDKKNNIALVPNSDDTPARKLVSESMVLANMCAALYADQNNLPFLYRSQEQPDPEVIKAAEAVPEGPAREFKMRGTLKRSAVSTEKLAHASLGVSAYCQATSPIRRVLDLILVRQLSHHLATDTAIYSTEDLQELYQECSAGIDQAQLIQKERNRYWLLKYLELSGQKEFKGTIVRADAPRPLIEFEELRLIFPFNPKKPLPPEGKPELLGKEVCVKVTKLSPRRERLFLSEI